MIVLITGASSGFGEAMARRFVSGGRRVIAAARRTDRLARLRGELGERLLPVTMDVTDPASIEQGLARLPEAWRPIDVLINNAGLALGTETAPRCSAAEWMTMIDTNVKGLAAVTHAVLPGMVARDSGLIINLGSIAGRNPYPGGNVYGATKAFVEQFTRNLRADLVGTGVRATDLAPGLVGGTEFSNVRYRGDDAAAAKVYAGATALTPEDIAEAAWWVANLPPRVNITFLEIMPTCQGYGPMVIQRSASVSA
ncbi:MAG: SDR family NAD(P)-dependent oxidoreductase [Candidatus Accumulibacter sp.]|jgi:3-hydroxy acid dehydrogenase/malonic semialdehyde reductase|nr:SDR family NAD(P)-dependent oxidoreductase [Accumulibacter sp.]